MTASTTQIAEKSLEKISEEGSRMIRYEEMYFFYGKAKLIT